MTESEQDYPTPTEGQPEQAESGAKPVNAGAWKARIQACKNLKRKLIPSWSTNIDYRRGKPYSTSSDEDRISVPSDWIYTKAKQASLFSQVPQIRVNHPPQTAVGDTAWIHAFEQRLNDTLVTAGIESAMEECLPDCINAAGIGAVLVSHEVLTEDVEIPGTDLSVFPPEVAAEIEASGFLPDGTPFEPSTTVPRVCDRRYLIERISPADLLWPVNFTSSDWDKAPWLGRTNRVNWAEAQQMFKLTDEEKNAACGDMRQPHERLNNDTEIDRRSNDEVVQFDEIFYWDHKYDSNVKSYNTICRLVFVPGREEPVVNETWSGQKADGPAVVGALKFPIRVLTLTYITDDTIPPSDSAIARPQVDELNKSRTQMMMQRAFSYPVRWFNSDRVDVVVAQALMRGTWQHMIPVQGNGDGVIGEVSRSSFPQENYTFDNVIKSDQTEAWSIGPNQSGTFASGRQSASESKIVQTNYSTRISKERARVTKFVCSIAEVLGGLLCLFEDPASFGQGFDPMISRALVYSILIDSTVIQDTNERREVIKEFVNFTAKSGYLDIEPVLKEYATLCGVDPAVIRAPQPKSPDPLTTSFRLSGTEDLLNPIVLAMLLQSGQGPKPEMIEQAKQMIASVAQFLMAVKPLTAEQVPATPMPTEPPTAPPVGPPMGGQGPVGPPPMGGPMGPQGAPPAPFVPPLAPLPVPAPGPLATPPAPAAPGIGEAHTKWGAMDRINARVVDRPAGSGE